jgi:hypothetical protein
MTFFFYALAYTFLQNTTTNCSPGLSDTLPTMRWTDGATRGDIVTNDPRRIHICCAVIGNLHPAWKGAGASPAQENVLGAEPS